MNTIQLIIATFLLAITSPALDTQDVQAPSPAYAQPPQSVVLEIENQPNQQIELGVVTGGGSWTTINTREGFHTMLTAVNEASDTESFRALSNIDEGHVSRLTGTAWYYDFVNIVDDVVLNEVRVNHNYITISYCDTNDTESGTMVIQTIRRNNADSEVFIAGRRRSISNPEDVIINGNPALKKVGQGFNQYWWVQDGHALFLRIPQWLLARHPEETFFDIQRIDVQ